MNTYFTDSALDLEALPSETIALEYADINQAIALSQQHPNEAQKWQIYLNILALSSFEIWLKARAPELTSSWESHSLLKLPSLKIFETNCYLQISNFKFCIIPIGSLMDEEIYLPRAAIDSPELIAHFYVAIEVMEELESALIKGFLRGDRLLSNLKKAPLPADLALNYPLYFSWFETNLEDFLLYFRFLNPAAIPLINTPQSLIISQFIKPLTSLQQPAVNVWHWLQNEMDEFTAQLSWVLLPTFATEKFRWMNIPEAIVRSPMEELDAILVQLERRGTSIPANARGAYQNLPISSIPLRLYVVTWSLLSAESIPEWKLLLILGSPTGSNLPDETKMQVSDPSSILVEQVATTDAPYLYARVAGTWDEEFNVTISLKNGETLALPPFGFHPQ
ncbi:MAG: DUF1822 family protein [Actinomycetota bacterium]